MHCFYYVNSPFAEMRAQPEESAEIVSEAFYSEAVRLLEEKANWVKIETEVDGYAGWMQKSHLCSREKPFSQNPNKEARVNRCSAHLYTQPTTTYGPLLTIPFESRVELLSLEERESESRWLKVALIDGREAYIQRGDLVFHAPLLSAREMCSLSTRFLGFPYTYGGRSGCRFDCSGFAQMLYRQRGIFLPRDSKDQIHWQGFISISIAALQPGDLIFWGSRADAIGHVGIYLGEDQFIHATVAENNPCIRVSTLSSPEWNGSGRLCYRAARTLAAESP